MATYAAFKHVELYNVGKAKKRVLKPPGGGSSDIFGTANGSATPRSAASTPRSAATAAAGSKNHMASNIFGAPHSRNGDMRRNPTADSHNRLFGEVERIQPVVKSHSKSNIPFGGADAIDAAAAAAAAPAATTNGKSNGHHQHGNGNGVASIVHAENGSSSNGNSSNGNGHHAAAANGNGNGHGNALNGNNGHHRAAAGGDVHLNGNGTKHEQPEQCGSPRNTNASLVGGATTPRQRTPNGNASEMPPPPSQSAATTPRRPNHSINNNSNDMAQLLETHDAPLSNGSSTTSSLTSNAPSQAASHATTHSSTTSSMSVDEIGAATSPRRLLHTPRRPAAGGAFTPRNPVTGLGIEQPMRRARRAAHQQNEAAASNRDGGNPVTGLGYRGGDNHHQNTATAPTLNGTKQVINKNRIPPGGFSSGLW